MAGVAKVVLITGASSGIGAACAARLAADGHRVFGTTRGAEPPEAAGIAWLTLDVRDTASVERGVREVVDAAGRIDVLVNNAGIGIAGAVEDTTPEDLLRQLDTNLLGPLRLVRATAKHMREQGAGRIVQISSLAGRIGVPFQGAYSASKFALEGLSEALKREVEHFGIKVAIIEPGFFQTTVSDNAYRVGTDTPPYDALEQAWQEAAERLRGGEAPGPEAVVHAIADVVESDAPAFRTPVGDDAVMVMAARDAMDDEPFEQAMRDTLEMDW